LQPQFKERFQRDQFFDLPIDEVFFIKHIGFLELFVL